ncbi:MAG: TATA-binding protein-associated factor mot1 [Watsoniomyces obsoletus]|nr:MAG: TATA-binding protein-associated factor mot1 [Watsoniomyces obsoletus]
MASRLDRLVTLLETGSTSLIRQTAAQQLAEVQRQHPDDLFNLLIRVIPYLRAKSWDTRTAAAKAIGGIVENAPRFEPDDPEVLPDGADPVDLEPLPDDQLQLETLDLPTILAHGQKLLGSAGNEYDVSLAGMDPATRLAHQKKRLMARLGLGGEYMDEDLVNETDIGAPSVGAMPKLDTSVGRISRQNSFALASAASNHPATPSSATPGSAGVGGDDTGLSKRQLNQLKRKNKMAAKNPACKIRVVDLAINRRASTNDIDSPAVAEPRPIKSEIKTEDGGSPGKELLDMLPGGPADDGSPIVAAYKGPAGPDPSALQTEAEEEGREWPFDRLCAFMMVDLFDHNWEVRHGAAMGLREVIRVHGAGAGRERGRSRAVNDRLNERWLSDLACRLCCVFMLDRFGDYISDTVVAPIRETVGQTLGALLAHLPASSVRLVYEILYRLVMQEDLGRKMRVWEVGHGGMIGLRYLVAVRNDLLLKDNHLIDGVLRAVMKGLGDLDDDVRAVSAATLIPIASDLVNLRPGTLPTLINVVWDCLEGLRDDLSASTGSVMDLLAKLCTFPEVLEAMRKNAAADECHSFDRLVPRLYPFLRHTITTVRSAVLRALTRFLSLEDADMTTWVDGKILRLVFQNLLVERNEEVLLLSQQVWRTLMTSCHRRGRDYFREEFMPHLDPLITLTLHPIGVSRHPIPMDPALFLRPSGQTYGLPVMTRRMTSPLTAGGAPAPKRRRKAEPKEEPAPSTHNVDGHMIQGDVDLVSTDVLIRSRIYAARAMGLAISFWPAENAVEDFGARLVSPLQSPYATSQMAALITMESYAREVDQPGPLGSHFATAVHPIIDEEPPPAYRELVPLLQIVRAQCQSLLNAMAEIKKPNPAYGMLAVVVQGDADAGPGCYKIRDAEVTVQETYPQMIKRLSAADRIKALAGLTATHDNCARAVEDAKQAKEQRDIRVRAAAAGALVALNDVPKKPSQIIKGMMDSIKTEENLLLQQRSAQSLAGLVRYFVSSGRRGPVDKVTSNLVKFSCVDVSETPEFHRHQSLETAILSLRKEEDRKDHVDAAKFEREQRQARIMRRGAKEALEQLSQTFGADLLEQVPTLRGLMEDALRQVFSGQEMPSNLGDADNELGQQVVDGLSTIRTLVPSLHVDLRPFILGLLPLILKALHSTLSVLRYAAAKCLATICGVIPVEAMTFLVENVLPAVSNPVDLRCRQGGVECIYHLIHVMEDKILPYVVFLIVPVLGRMSDSDNEVRLLATTSFATLVKLVPLEAGIPDPPGFSEALLRERDHERKFIAQMLDVHKVEPFEIPVTIKAQLRSYQQEGVNWLAFLNRYHLHGILCDDMGLGKTLQTLCIVASDHHLRAEAYSKTKAAEVRRLPSLIVCPPTLSGHWQQEIRSYAPFLSSLAYVGNPGERYGLQSKLKNVDVVITSYDICRNDANVLSPINWNYCVLDEGHLIKNSKAKVTMAVKRLKSEHRLILSGTPIQNNVLELWSLFDFLMPGFLGTEKVFWDRFAKPIAASRNSKSSSKEQEAGALAIEALHKQVLPFLLRRLKEEVLDDLPPKIIQNYYCEMSELQKKLFDDFNRKEGKTLADKANSGEKEAKQHIFQALQYMRKLCNSPALVMKPGHKQYGAIQQQLAKQQSTLNDVVHAPKLTALRDLLVDCGIGVDNNSHNNPNNPNNSKSMGGGEDLMTETNTSYYVSPHRALIFCQMKEMLDIVQSDVLKKLLPSVQYLRLDGSVEANKRQEIVNRFNSDPSYDVLLLTTSVGGLGLNLTGADTVIFVEHDWNPQKDLQAMDRAHRIGQKKVVNVYRLITRGTLEEKIMGLQRFKIDMASTIVNQQNAGLGTMETDQILDLFTLGETTTSTAGSSSTGGGGSGNGGEGGEDSENAVDIVTGQVKEKGKKGLLEDLGELWDEKGYREEYDLDNFLASMKV